MLNENKCITEVQEEDGYRGCFYYSNGQIIGYKYLSASDGHAIYEDEYIWNNDNLRFINGAEIILSNIENKTNIDLYLIMRWFTFDFNGENEFLLNGYLGKRSKYLVSQIIDGNDIENYEYILDKDGYPIEIKETNQDGETESITFIEYQ